MCQLNRGSDKDKRKPVISDLRESGARNRIATCILLHRPTNEDGSGTGDAVLIIGKNRTDRRRGNPAVAGALCPDW